ncbi:unnamed protein product [Prorocentrum cordatum]|uniref:RRM domain-containing protein n=1 Tax=Prorocentrum cordatum TaxID=2364126 RepID=A0ABN9UWG4_9DINO|nr:unnamed protein product [Polarella glacialis]
MSQDRKVFVGGVPQDLTQDELYTIFCEYAGVKKAWLQKCRPADHGSGNGSACPPQNHRGFGFVIFHEARAIDDLLGSGASRFILLRNGAKLEVKRALSSNKMGTTQADAVCTAPPLQRNYPPQGQDISQQAVAKPALRGQAHSGFRDIQATGQRPQAPSSVPAWPGLAGGAPGGAGGNENVLRQLSLMPPPALAGYHSAPQGLPAGLGGMQHPGAGRPPPPPQPPSDADGRQQLDGLAGAYGAGVALAAWAGSPPQGGMDAGDRNGVPQEVLAGLVLSTGAPGTQQGLRGSVEPARSPPGAGTPPEGTGRAQGVALQQAVVQYYHDHVPEKLAEHKMLDTIGQSFLGHEAELSEELRCKYGAGLQLTNDSSAQVVSGGGVVGWQQHSTSQFGPPGVLASGARHHAQAPAVGAAGVGAAPFGARPPAYAAGGKDRALNLGVWGDHALAGAHDVHNESASGHEGPDLSWIEGIVGDEGMDFAEDINHRVASEPQHRAHMWGNLRDGQQVW